jgi:hypothetical protein
LQVILWAVCIFVASFYFMAAHKLFQVHWANMIFVHSFCRYVVRFRMPSFVEVYSSLSMFVHVLWFSMILFSCGFWYSSFTYVTISVGQIFLYVMKHIW